MWMWIGLGIAAVLLGAIVYFSSKNKRFEDTYNEQFEMEKERSKKHPRV